MWLKYNKVVNPYTWWLESLDRRYWKPNLNELVVMFGYSGIGKTEYTFWTAKRNAEVGNKVCYISLELPKEDMIHRICTARAVVSKWEFQTNNFTDQQRMLMDSKYDELMSLSDRLAIVEPKDHSIQQVIQTIRNYYDFGVKLFYIDNLDKVTLPSAGNDENKRHWDITSMLQDLKNELKICIVLIHHASKKSKWTLSNAPAWLEGIRGSQKIVDNSTNLFEIFRDLSWDDPMDHNVTEVVQLKDSMWWPKGKVKLVFDHWEYKQYDEEEQKLKVAQLQQKTNITDKPF